MPGMEVEVQGRKGTFGEEAPERSEGERSSPERSAGASSPNVAVGGGEGELGSLSSPDPEVSARPVRRRFGTEYKLGILREADGCAGPGQVGALLRREGLYSSHLTLWRHQRQHGRLGPNKRGRKASLPNPLAPRVAELERENRQLTRRLTKAETIIEFQKKLSELLGIPLKSPESEKE